MSESNSRCLNRVVNILERIGFFKTSGALSRFPKTHGPSLVMFEDESTFQVAPTVALFPSAIYKVSSKFDVNA